MTQDCPLCGSPLESSERTIRVHVLECGSCHHHFSMLPHTGAVPTPSPDEASSLSPIGSAADPAAPATPGDAPAAASAENDDSPVCGTCGSNLIIRTIDDVTIEVECPQCDETTRFRAQTGEPAEAPRAERPRFREDRGRGGGADPSRARGCRRCGGPLEFESLPDGGRVGRCANCGNEFRLPPLRDDDRGGFGRPRSGGGGGFRRFPSRGGFPGRGRPGGGRPPFRGRPSYRRDDDSDGDEDRPRRRRPRDSE